MGMYDSICGEIPCPKCGGIAEVEIQFKWGDCTLACYYVGDRIEPHYSGIQWVHHDYCDAVCKTCGELTPVYARLMNGWVEGLYTDPAQAPDPPRVPAVSFRETLYQRAVDAAEGNCREHLPFDRQPSVVGATLIAFGKEWTVLDRWRDDLTNQYSISWLRGCIGRRSTSRYVYRLALGEIERWAEVSDHEPGHGGFFGGNVTMLLSEPEVEHGYVRTRLEEGGQTP